MIAPSEFSALSASGLEPVTLAIVEKYNGENIKPGYYHRRFLNPVQSLDGTWNTLQINNKAIVADVVALDSALPLKRRPSASKVAGELPKLGTKLSMNETQLRQLRLMLAAGSDILTIMKTFFADVDRVYESILEQWEAMFLEGLSSGLILIDVDTNVGTGIRVDFGYKAENMFNPAIVWDNTGYTPITDLIKVYDKALNDGNQIVRFIMPRAQQLQILKSAEAKNLFANSIQMESVSFQPTIDQLNSALMTNYGFELEVIQRTVTYEINGVQTTVNPWKAGSVIGLTSDQVGSLVYSQVEEETARVGGVEYAVGENRLLVKQYRLVDPSLKQMTCSEAVSLCVISEVERIYKLDVTVAEL